MVSHMKRIHMSKRIILVIMLFCTIWGIVLSASDAFASGSGVIEIKTVEDLYNIRYDMAGSYILKNDIDLSQETAADGAYSFLGNGWDPIGSDSVYGNIEFTGSFNGNGHKIIGLNLNVTTVPSGASDYIYLGLFANNAGTIKNLTFVDGTITKSYTGKHVYAGNAAGYNTGLIYNCNNYNTVNVQSNACINRESSASGTQRYVDSFAVVGGLIGFNEDGDLVRCNNYATIMVEAGSGNASTATTRYNSIGTAGGIVGETSGDYTIELSSNMGQINARSTNGYVYAGGIASQVLNLV